MMGATGAAWYAQCTPEPAVPTFHTFLPSLLLLLQDPAKRLGARAGGDEVKQHPWFSSINWALLRCQTPPFVPKVAAPSAGAAPGAPMGTHTADSVDSLRPGAGAAAAKAGAAAGNSYGVNTRGSNGGHVPPAMPVPHVDGF